MSGSFTEKPRFVIQKHDVKKLHFDFSLEIKGVLKSWALPDGFSPQPGETRLAIPTVDHSLDFADFEGIIPKHRYGSGTIMLWDIGTYENLMIQEGKPVPMQTCYNNGQIEVKLNGERIAESYILVKSEEKQLEECWYIVKMDDKATSVHDPVHSEDKSILTGRTMDQIKRGASTND